MHTQALLEYLREEGTGLGIELADDGKGEYAVISDRVRLAPFNPVLSDLDARLRAMDASRRRRPAHLWLDRPHCLRTQPSGRGRVLTPIQRDHGRGSRRTPDRLLPLGTVPLQDPARAAEELAVAISDIGMAGVQIATTVDGTDLDKAGAGPLLGGG